MKSVFRAVIVSLMVIMTFVPNIADASSPKVNQDTCYDKVYAKFKPAPNKYGNSTPTKFMITFMQGPFPYPKYGDNPVFWFKVYPDYYKDSTGFDIDCVVSKDFKKILGIERH